MRAHVKDVCFSGYTSYIPYLWAFYLVTNPVTLLVTYFLNWLHLAAYLIGFGYCGQKLPCRAGLLPKSKGRKKSPSWFLSGETLPKGRSRSPEAL